MISQKESSRVFGRIYITDICIYAHSTNYIDRSRQVSELKTNFETRTMYKDIPTKLHDYRPITIWRYFFAVYFKNLQAAAYQTFSCGCPCKKSQILFPPPSDALFGHHGNPPATICPFLQIFMLFDEDAPMKKNTKIHFFGVWVGKDNFIYFVNNCLQLKNN